MHLGKCYKLLFSLALLICLGIAQPAEAKKKTTHHTTHTHKAKKHARAGVSRSASYSDLVIDAETGQILHATDPDSLRHPASLTKMMTAYMAFQAIESGKLSLDDTLPVSANAAEQEPSKLGLRPGQRIKVEDALLGLATESANDAAVVLAEGMGGSEAGFADMMTRQAHALGMSRTHFNNPSGLPNDGQITTARDMAILGDALIYHFPQFYSFFSHDEFTYAGISHHNHNHLMDRYDGMDGIKTGYIRASGFNLVASAKRGDTRLIGVVFGGHSTLERDNRMAQLLDQAFDRVENGTTVANTSSNGQGDSDDDGAGASGYVRLPAKPTGMVLPRQQGMAQPVVMKPLSGGGGWGVQVGAYSDADVARQKLASLINASPQVLARTTPVVVKVSSGGTAMYRARLMSMDQHLAEAVCASYQRQGQACQTVSP